MIMSWLNLGARARAERAEAKGRHFAALGLWRRLAARGDAQAAFRVGRLYEQGRGVVRDPVEAAHWYRQAADGNHGAAQLQLGRLLINGARASLPAGHAAEDVSALFPRGAALAADPAQAIAWLTAAAETGESEACVILGALYFEGRKVARDLDAARRWYERGAAAGDAHAQFGLADLLYNAPGGEADPVAEAWYEKAAQQGHARAQTAMGFIAQTRDLAAAGAWYERAAAQGEVYALDAAARMRLSGEGLARDAARAEGFWREAAKRGHLGAMVALAGLYEERRDGREALLWRRKAAAAGHVESQFLAAQMLSAGADGAADPNEAARLYAEAAGAGHAVAAFNLGALIASHPANDPAEALPWYRAAAARGVAQAAGRLAELYLDESLSCHDKAEGMKWLKEAAASDPEAKARYALRLLPAGGEAAGEAERLLLEVAGPERPEVCFALGDLNARGLAAQARPEEALRWFGLAAAAGHIEARYVLALAMLAQTGDAAKRAAGVAALHGLAEAGHAGAQFQLGVRLSSGGPAELRAAVGWYRRASAAGHALAQYNLGVMLTRGLGASPDVAEGMRLIARAVEKGVVAKQSSAA